LPGRGYGIRYDYGMFKQNIVDGRQKESPDYWLEYGNPWEFERHNTRYKVRFGGRIQQEGKHSRWVETEEIIAEAYDQISRASTPTPPTRCVCGAPGQQRD
jgi:starch phosphorylase